MATTTKHISLDFYNNHIVTINAKQYDTNSRFINVTCVDHGKKVFLDPAKISVFIRYKKADGKNVFNDALVLEDGTVNFELTQQMLAIPGRQVLDLMIVAVTDMTVGELNEINDVNEIYNLDNITVVSTMNLYINVISTTVEHPSISSRDEFDALINMIGALVDINKKSNENENVRISNEEARKTAEIQREILTRDAVDGVKDALKGVNDARDKANEAATNANDAANLANTNAESAETSSIRAENAAIEAEKLIDEINNIGIILQDEKGVENGVVPLNEEVKIDNDYLNKNDLKIDLGINTINNTIDSYGFIQTNDISVLPITHGGTGATNLFDAQENLGINTLINNAKGEIYNRLNVFSTSNGLVCMTAKLKTEFIIAEDGSGEGSKTCRIPFNKIVTTDTNREFFNYDFRENNVAGTDILIQKSGCYLLSSNAIVNVENHDGEQSLLLEVGVDEGNNTTIINRQLSTLSIEPSGSTGASIPMSLVYLKEGSKIQVTVSIDKATGRTALTTGVFTAILISQNNEMIIEPIQ